MEPKKNRTIHIVLALLLPFICCWLQWHFWTIFKPFVWFLFFPTVYFSSRIGGKTAGLISTATSALLVVYFFIPPQLSLVDKNPNNLYSVVVFIIMGLLFSYTHDRLERADRRAVEALEASNIASELLQEATIGRLQAEQKLMKDHLHLSEERFRMLFEHSIDAIMLTRTDGTILTANPEACRVFGLNEAEICRAGHAGLVDMADPRSVELLEQRSRLGRCRGEITMIRGDGSRFPAEISSAVFADHDGVQKTSLIIRDATERKSLEQQLLQSQKMEAVGTLAGGIAHDFNNILTAIIGYSTLLQMGLKVDGKPKEYIDNLITLVEKASSLTKGLLAFSRNQIMSPKLINLNDVVATITKLISRLIGETIAIKTDLSAGPLTIMADCGQIEQVLMNLATNARDAMPSGGNLAISTDVVTLHPENLLLTDPNQQGLYARIAVSDTGSGMEEATIARIFEPFFTTKESGKGTGLGLSILYGIIKQHKGFVSVSSSTGSGTSFIIHIPLASEAEAEALGSKAPPVSGGAETLLLVEDDAAIRTVLSQMLHQFGYRVFEGADGEEAIELFRENAAEVSLVIMDMIMPRKNGREAFEAMVEIQPEVKALFISGYPPDVILQKKLLPEGALFLPKPVSPMELLRGIRIKLDGDVTG